MLHSAKSAFIFTTMQPRQYTLNRPSSTWGSFNIKQKLGLFVFVVTHISNLPTIGVKLMQMQLTPEISIFVKILFNFKKKKISLNKGKPSRNHFNIAKNQEFASNKNLTSPKPAWNSQWSLIPSRNLKL